LLYRQALRKTYGSHGSASSCANKAIYRYYYALEVLTAEAFLEMRFATLIDLSQALLLRRNLEAPDDLTTANQVQTEALALWQRLFSQSPTQKLYQQYQYLLRTHVDLAILNNNPRQSLTVAELHKNQHLRWFLHAQDQQGSVDTLTVPEIEQLHWATIALDYPQLRQLLAPQRAIIYWHLSPQTLTTFILRHDHEDPIVLISNHQMIEDWFKIYNQVHEADGIQQIDWESLRSILQIDEINTHLDTIAELILIPHRHLHRLPLQSFWRYIDVVCLPSIRTGLKLAQSIPHPNKSLLLIKCPDYANQSSASRSKSKNLSNLVNASVAATILTEIFNITTDNDIIPTGKVTTTNLIASFETPRRFAHFSGHAYHDSDRPLKSSLMLDADEEFTCQDFQKLNLQPYYLVSLSACQTGTTGQLSEDEYIGLASACLSRGTNYVLSTLWEVRDLSSSMFVIHFYSLIDLECPPPTALRQTATWLRELTYQKVADFYANLATQLPPSATDATHHVVASNRRKAEEAAKQNPEECPYANPYYWAAFTLSGFAHTTSNVEESCL
jgi:CHAT domain-containing protein